MTAKTNCSLDNTLRLSCCTHYLKSINAMRNSNFLTFSRWLRAF